jgi:membrane protease YdiL (CAAX protease family)
MLSSSSKEHIAGKGTARWFLNIGVTLAFVLWTIVAVFVIGGFIGGVAFYGGMAQWGIEIPPDSAVLRLVLSVFVYTIGMMILLIEPYALRKMAVERVRELIGLARWPMLKDLGYGLMAWGAYMALTTLVTIGISSYAPGVDLEQAQDIGFNALTGSLDVFYAFLVIVVIVPIVEEVVFRGYLYGSLRPRMPWWVAAIVVSVLFGVVHGQINVAIDTFFLSMVLCYLRDRTGAIWSGIFVHALKNGLAFYLLFLAPEWLGQLLMGK